MTDSARPACERVYFLTQDCSRCEKFIQSLQVAGVQCTLCPGAEALIDAMRAHAGPALICEDSLNSAQNETLLNAREVIDRRDTPVIILRATPNGVPGESGLVRGLSNALPIAPDTPEETVISTVRTAMRLCTRLREELQTLETISRIGTGLAATLDVDRLVQAITDAGTELTGAKFGAFFYNVLDDRGETYMLYTLSGAPREAFSHFPMPRNTEIFAPTFAGKRVVRSDDITRDPRYGKNAPHSGMPRGHLPVRSYLAVPVLSNTGQVLGGLFFGHTEVGVFAERQERIGIGVAAQAAVAIDNARLHRSLQISEERYGTLIAQVKDYAIFAVDLKGNATSWNDGVERVLGWGKDEFIGLSIERLFTPEDVAAGVPSKELVTAHERGSVSDDRWMLRKDGTRFFATGITTRTTDADGKVTAYTKVLRDQTTWKQAEELREELLKSEQTARAEAEETSRLKDEFLATLSHELRTPLTAILGWAQLINRGKMNAEQLYEAMGTIERSARAQAQLIEDLLDMSRIESGKVRIDVQRLDLARIADLAIQAIKPAADAKNIRIQRVFDTEADVVMGDPGRLQQVIWNLLSNAVKFTPRDGKVQVLLQRVNSHVELSIIDTGEGIKAEFLPYLFERFRQQDASATRRHGGLGIGLALVRQLVELHGGRVRANSAGVGQGATFTVELPLLNVDPTASASRRHPNSVEAEEPPESEVSLQGLRILAVDDEPDSRDLVRFVLESAGARVIAVSTALEALDELRRQPPDLLLSDIGMPDLDGYDLIRAVRALPAESGGQTPAVALTAFARSEDRTRALRAGYQGQVVKPVDPNELLAMVASLARAPGPA